MMTEILIGVGVGLLLIFIAVISGALLLVKIARSRNRIVQQPTAASTQPRTLIKEVMIKYTPWLLGISVIVVWLYATDNLPDFGDINYSLWIAIIILLILAGRALILHVSTKRAETAALVIVVGGLLFFGTDAPKVWKKVQGGVSSVVLSESKSAKDDAPSDKPLGPIPQGRNWETKSVVWKELNPDGSILMNTPSETIQIRDYCTVMYSNGNGREYQVLNQGVDGEWTVHRRGDHVAGTGFRIMVIKKGVKEVTYQQSCP